MQILNLGCGTKVSKRQEVINIDWSIYLRVKRNPFLRLFVPLLFRGARLQQYLELGDNVMTHNLANGIPFPDASVDVAYHSHVLEHLDPPIAERFLLEIKRVLKPGGILRIAVPDMESVCRRYLEHINIATRDPIESSIHDTYIAAIIGQCVQREASGSSRQSPTRRLIENLLLGDARKRGQTHQWMYDRVSLCALLQRLGYKEPKVFTFNTSMIPDWHTYGFDQSSEGEYIPGSLYIEACV